MSVRLTKAKGSSVAKSGGGGLSAVTTADTNTIDFTGDGTPGLPLEADAIISPDAGNLLSARANGLYGTNPVSGFATFANEAELLAICANATIKRAFGVGPVSITNNQVFDLLGRSLWVSGEPIDAPSAFSVKNGAFYLDGKFRTPSACTLTLQGADMYCDNIISQNDTADTLTINSAGGSRNFSYGWNGQLVSIVSGSGGTILRNIVQGDGETLGPTSYKTTAVNEYARLWRMDAEGAWQVQVIDVTGQNGAVFAISREGPASAGLSIVSNSGAVLSAYIDTSFYLWVRLTLPSRALRASASPLTPIWFQNQPDLVWSPSSSASAPAPYLAFVSAGGASLTAEQVWGATGPVDREPTGFTNLPTDAVTLSWTDAVPDRTLTITPTIGGQFTYWIKGVKYTKVGAQTFQISDVEGLHFVYYNGATLVESVGTAPADLFADYTFVFLTYWNATAKTSVSQNIECHGIVMDWATHEYLHTTRGSAIGYVNGGAYNISGVTPDANDLSLGVGNGQLWDEDLEFNFSAVASPATIPVLSLTGAGLWRRTAVAGKFVKQNSGANTLPLWNQFSVGVWSEQPVTNGNYCLYHLFATDDLRDGVISVMGQAQYSTKALARDGARTEILNLQQTNLPSLEYRALYTFIIYGSTSLADDAEISSVNADNTGSFIDWRTGISGGSSGSGGVTPLVSSFSFLSFPVPVVNNAGTAFAGNQQYSERVTMSYTTTFTQIGFYVAVGSGSADTIWVGIYDATGTTLLRSASISNPGIPVGWNWLTIPGLAVTAGVDYWLSVKSSGGSITGALFSGASLSTFGRSAFWATAGLQSSIAGHTAEPNRWLLGLRTL